MENIKVDAASGDVMTMFRTRPMVAFNPASFSQHESLLEVAKEIRIGLSEMWEREGVMKYSAHLVTGKFWLWVLGSYELARTLRARCATKFPELSARFREYEAYIKPLRIPMAKQEFAGEPGSRAWPSTSAVGPRFDPPDFEYEIQGRRYSITDALATYERIFCGFRFEDVEPVIKAWWHFPE